MTNRRTVLVTGSSGLTGSEAVSFFDRRWRKTGHRDAESAVQIPPEPGSGYTHTCTESMRVPAVALVDGLSGDRKQLELR